MNNPTIKAGRLAYVRVSAPDLEEAQTFLLEFGLQVATRTSDSIYLRGSESAPHCYILSEGTPGVQAIAFEADTLSDLEKITTLDGASDIDKLDEPAGGQVVRLRDPMGMQVEIVHGQARLEATKTPPPHDFNMDGRRSREGDLPSIQRGPSHVRRIGHLVLESADPVAMYRWYHETLGLKKADEIHLPSGGTQMLFASLDRGAEFVDHHVVGFQYALDEGSRVQHIAFEVGNFDDLMAGHAYLKAKRRKNVWGVGRHRYGGQIFDYWASPLGVIHEHWTDTDLVNQDHVPTDSNIVDMKDYWGPPPSLAFAVSRWNFRTVKNLAGLLGARMRGGR